MSIYLSPGTQAGKLSEIVTVQVSATFKLMDVSIKPGLRYAKQSKGKFAWTTNCVFDVYVVGIQRAHASNCHSDCSPPEDENYFAYKSHYQRPVHKSLAFPTELHPFSASHSPKVPPSATSNQPTAHKSSFHS